MDLGAPEGSMCDVDTGCVRGGVCVCVLEGGYVPRLGVTWSGAALRNCSNRQERPRSCMPRASFS